MRRSSKSADPVCYWCGISTDTETGYRGYDPDDPIMAEFGGSVSAIVCTPACPARPTNGVIHQPFHLKGIGSYVWDTNDMMEAV